ncbi:serine hydrolase [Streptomyces pharetrae]|uniref:serine hydrolase n=1 Tax=Streptomyces pharetrae TaxID=291370 RepID=UPI00334BC5D3
MPDGQLDKAYEESSRPRCVIFRPHALAACATAAVMASLTACSSTGTFDEVRPSVARSDALVDAMAGPPSTNLGAALAQSLEPVLMGGDARLAVAVLDLDSADRKIASYQGDALFTTASISKVNILAALLLQAQDQGRDLTAEERQAADAMIRTSDNDAANFLWAVIGKGEGLDAANERLGLTSTHGGPGNRWGLTRTTAKDQVRLLQSIFHQGLAGAARAREGLDPESKAYIRELMGDITEGQDWGVSAASPRWSLKNGWLQRSTTGRWVINSTGQVTLHGHRYLVSALSSGHASEHDGISLIERAVRAAIDAASAHARHKPTGADAMRPPGSGFRDHPGGRSWRRGTSS